MANAIYPKWKEALGTTAATGAQLTGAAVVKAALIDTGTYTYSSAHEFKSSLTGIVGTPGAIGTVTFTNGILDGDDVVFSSVTGSSVEAIVIYIDTGNAATSRLVAYLDTGITGLPVTPNGGNITITWDNGSSKIFQL